VGKRITTIEAVGHTPAGKKVQAAWLALDVPQCGYCQSGQIMSAAALLAAKAEPSDVDIDVRWRATFAAAARIRAFVPRSRKPRAKSECEMTNRELVSPSRRCFLTATAAVGGGLLLGFGLPARGGPTAVVWNTETVHAATSGDAQRAQALALGCAGCHGAEGVSPSEAFPNLAGLSEDVMYKALKDYRDGKRQNPTMQGIAGALDDQKIADLGAFYASLASKARNPAAAPPSLVAVGSPIRSIAPCAACHGPLGRKDGAPSLEGQKRAYLKAQLDAFASGTRHNDINQQMRQIARALSATERDSVAEWYGSQPSQ
jgi:cytochrome c553